MNCQMDSTKDGRGDLVIFWNSARFILGGAEFPAGFIPIASRILDRVAVGASLSEPTTSAFHPVPKTIPIQVQSETISLPMSIAGN